MSSPADLLRGDIPLGRTYWWFGVVPNGLLAIAVHYLTGQSGFMATRLGVWLTLGLSLLAIAYVPIISVAIWQSASKYKGPGWLAVLAKTVVVIGAIRFFGEIATLPFGAHLAARP